MFPSLMPEGVEHKTEKRDEVYEEGVFPSLMPEGVEHPANGRWKRRDW